MKLYKFRIDLHMQSSFYRIFSGKTEEEAMKKARRFFPAAKITCEGVIND